MPRQTVLQGQPMQPQQGATPHDVLHRADKLWLSTRDLLTEELCAVSMRAAYAWLHRHGIVRRGDGKVSRLDVRRALKQPSGRGRHSNSQRNLRSRHTR